MLQLDYSRQFSLLGVCAALAFATACGDDDDGADAGTGGDAGVTADGGSTTDGGSADTLYDRLGGNAGIAGAVDAIVAAQVQDPEIAAFFAPNTAAGAVPNVTQIKECLVAQLGAAAGGPETYPTTVSGGYECRDMASAHAGLGISADVFDKFVMIAADTLTSAGVAAADVETIGSVLNGTKTAIVEDTLYARLGAERGISGAVDLIVAAEVQDPEIAAFFVPNTMAGAVPNVDQIKLCLVKQLSSVAGGRQTYPTTLDDGYMCRDMATAHAGLGIDSDVFDKFVMIAADTLTSSAGVSSEDVMTIGTVLNGTKDAIVE